MLTQLFLPVQTLNAVYLRVDLYCLQVSLYIAASWTRRAVFRTTVSPNQMEESAPCNSLLTDVWSRRLVNIGIQEVAISVYLEPRMIWNLNCPRDSQNSCTFSLAFVYGPRRLWRQVSSLSWILAVKTDDRWHESTQPSTSTRVIVEG